MGALNRDGFKSNYSNFGTAVTLSTVGGDDNDTGAAWSRFVADSGILTLGNQGAKAPAAAKTTLAGTYPTFASTVLV